MHAKVEKVLNTILVFVLSIVGLAVCIALVAFQAITQSPNNFGIGDKPDKSTSTLVETSDKQRCTPTKNKHRKAEIVLAAIMVALFAGLLINAVVRVVRKKSLA